VACLFNFNEGNDKRKVDHNLRYHQFWQIEGAQLIKGGARQPELTQAFER
jgi:hypothetical protein